MPRTPTIPEIGIPTVVIKADGQTLSPETAGDVVSVEIEDTVDLPAMCHFTLGFWNQARQVLKEEYLTKFKMGTSIGVAMGYDTPPTLFTGEVTALEPSFGGEEAGDTLVVRAYNRLHRLRFGTHQRTFEKMKDSEIASAIADEVGLSPEVKATPVKHPHVSQHNINNLSFLMGRAKPINYEVIVQDKTLFFRESREPAGPGIRLAYRRELLRFSPRQRTVSEGGAVEVRGWDVKTKKAILGKAGSGDEASKMGGSKTGAEISAAAFLKSTKTVTDLAVMDASEANGIAKAIYNRQQRNFVEAEGVCSGIPDLLSGSTVEIEEVGTTFSGTYYLTSVTHTFDEQGYQTAFKARRIAL